MVSSVRAQDVGPPKLSNLSNYAAGIVASRPPREVVVLRLRQKDQKNIDVLACAIDDRQKNRRAGHIGNLFIPTDVIGKFTREVDTPTLDLHLDRFGRG